MLVLSRKLQERIQIGDNITISILKVRGNTVRVGIEAPRDVRVVRGELPIREDTIESTTADASEADAAGGSQPIDEETAVSELTATAMQRYIAARCRRDKRMAQRCTVMTAELGSTLSGSA